ncbi:glycerophosphoryl diester phosphodiesterase [Pullulanibacillus pueri]|uniref:Glycerophosphoryl diester phosphodiesterase n=1 Tax=Pullulanibacillus pueri TaxID=1437324 RepID=A0A8J3ELP6_9BACL|nr:glycerophosphodiester phosphodiesterase [Pullulanibacillus pueri]MBM7681628.1 glycerophosphoryl diester phosphodiesterase [Pullulanibacillus pueri]GGH79394.1 glycerophosphoryl diester phosphodiesterase [Pullulanibacillus pueri]
MRTKIFAHRGASGKYPENTMTAFKQAEKEGADGIELDVHLTRDRIPIVIHDETVDRTTDGYGFVKDYSIEGLKKLSAGHWKGWKFRNAQIPTLEEVLQWMSQTSLTLLVEFKNNILPYKGLEHKTIDLLRKYNMLERTIFSSFNHESLLKVKQIYNGAETAALYGKPMASAAHYATSMGLDGLHPSYRIVNEKLVHELHANNIKIRPYTVNSPQVMEVLFDWQIDGIITDYPQRANEVLNRMWI